MKSKDELKRAGVGWAARLLYYIGAIKFSTSTIFRVRALHPIAFIFIIIFIILNVVVEVSKLIWRIFIDVKDEFCLW